jgi:hypothetical protein
VLAVELDVLELDTSLVPVLVAAAVADVVDEPSGMLPGGGPGGGPPEAAA